MLETDVYVWCYALLVVLATIEEEGKKQIHLVSAYLHHVINISQSHNH